eukprot:759513-Hanusia_phi.AAC.7
MLACDWLPQLSALPSLPSSLPLLSLPAPSPPSSLVSSPIGRAPWPCLHLVSPIASGSTLSPPQRVSARASVRTVTGGPSAGDGRVRPPGPESEHGPTRRVTRRLHPGDRTG